MVRRWPRPAYISIKRDGKNKTKKHYYARYTDQNGKERWISLDTTKKHIAMIRLREVNRELEQRGSGRQTERVTVADAVAQYFERTAASGQHKTLTQSRYRGILRRFGMYCHRAGVHHLCDLRSSHIEDYKDGRLKEVAAATVNTELRTISSFCSKTKTLGWLDANPVSGIEKPRVREKKIRVYTDNEVDRILEAANDDDRPVWVLLLNTGLREQELTHLTWADVANNWLYVRAKGDWSPKSGRSRKIPLTTDGCWALEELRKRRKGDSVLVVPSSSGGLERHLLRRLYRVRKPARVPDATLHAFRHTYASRLIRANVDVATVQLLLGHQSLKTTMIYLHSGDKEMRLAAERLSKSYGSSYVETSRESKSGAR